MTSMLTFEVDALNRVRSWPHEATDLLGRTASAALGLSWVKVLGARDPSGNHLCERSCNLHGMARRGEAIGIFEILTTQADGQALRLFVQAEPAASSGIRGLLLKAWPDRREGSMDRRSRAGAAKRTQGGAHKPGDKSLSAREAEVLRMLSRGQRTEGIAKRMNISVTTVRNHTQNALAKLGAATRSEAVALAIRRGLI